MENKNDLKISNDELNERAGLIFKVAIDQKWSSEFLLYVLEMMTKAIKEELKKPAESELIVD
jgi:hypothetical protein